MEHKTPDLKPVKYINDPIYGAIPISALELQLIDTPVFQRLRNLRQLAKVNFVFPSAEHSRYVHSLGVLHIMQLMTDHLLNRNDITEIDAIKLRVAALLHDIGHYPLSHLGEAVYGYIEDNEYAKYIVAQPYESNNTDSPLYELSSSHSKSAHHEALGKYIVIHNNTINSILESYGLSSEEIGEIFTGEIGSRNMVYSQLLHSSLDADRLDYLLRDSYQTGVKYGLVDLQYLIRLLMIVEDPELSEHNKILVCNKKGQHVVEHFLMSRYFHYSQVIYHKTNASFEGLIKSMYIKLVKSGNFIYNTLSDIHNAVNESSFLNFNDSFLDVALKEYFDKTNDPEYKALYQMYRGRIRPKTIYEMKTLYEYSPSSEFAVLKWHLNNKPEEITKAINTNRWGYQIVPISIEKIHSSYALSEGNRQNYAEELREAIKVFDEETSTISYLAEDRLSIMSKICNYHSEFIRIYVLDEPSNYNFNEMRKAIDSLIKSPR